MKRTVLLYGVISGVLIAGLELIEYRFLVIGHAIEIYGALVAMLFSALGIWLGLELTKSKKTVVVREVRVEVPVAMPIDSGAAVEATDAMRPTFAADAERIERLGITPRELEILELIAAGLSTREIAGRLFVSENTVKTHTSRLFDKLNARRRTQAVQIAKAAGIIA
jgi:two-component system, NarL family, response regulator LiaR